MSTDTGLINTPFVRFSHGTPLYPPNDIHAAASNLLKDLENCSLEEALRKTILRGNISGQRIVLPEATWYAIFQDFLNCYAREFSHSEHIQALLIKLLRLMSKSPLETAWKEVEQFLLDHIDQLSGWDKCWQKEDGENRKVFRGEDGNYYFHDLDDGILVQIEGMKTLPETRLDFIIGTIFHSFGLIKRILNTFSLFAISEDFARNPETYPLSLRLCIPELQSGTLMFHWHRTRDGHVKIKTDPLGFFSELRPQTASIAWDINSYKWGDKEWITEREKKGPNQPINVYEVHLGSWRDYGKEFPNYREVAVDLAAYCNEMGFTHVELMPIMEHPLDESWGYQVTGFFSATSRYGTPSDFQFFVDHLHQNGIGVILDWVPAHFPTDDFSLNRFDGTALYEHDDPRKGFHPHWNTAIFNYGRKEVANFLIASALFWFDKMHIDGFRVDAVASMVYLDYGRNAGEWIPNPDGSNFNIEAIEFLKHLNSIVHQKFPGALMIAEESSSYTGVTHQDGLGFDLKWNMGWMNDTLRYFSKDPVYRKHHQNDLTFSLLYTFTERFKCVLSHDEVVHGKGSLITKMPGPDWQKFANLRLLVSYMICHPGKKLFFMGGEVGQWNEWYCKGSLDWHLLQYLLHQGLFQMVKDINHFYLSGAELWGADFDWSGFEWIGFSDAEHSVISYMRKRNGKGLVCVHNFTPEYQGEYFIHLKDLRGIQEVFNTDHEKYGGSNRLNEDIHITPDGFVIALAPLATMIFKPDFNL